MADNTALFQLAIARCPVTIDKPEERERWFTQAVVGKTPQQLQETLDTDQHFGLSPDFVYDYAAQYIEAEREKGREIPGQNNPAIIDTFRQLSGAKPLFYDLAENGAAVPKDYLTEFYKQRAAHTQESGWRNFWNNTAYSVMEGTAGFTALGARLTDAIGATEGASLYWQRQTEEMEKILSPQGGVSGTLGKLVGNTMFSLLLGGAGAGSAAAKSGGALTWSKSLIQMGKEGLGVGIAFGLSETGHRFGTVATLREGGREVNTFDEMTYAFAGGAIEAATEAFGWGVAKGFGRTLIKGIPGLREVVGRKGMVGAIEYLTHLGKSAVGAAVGSAPAGAFEEVASQFGQNLLDRYMEVLPEELQIGRAHV